MTTFRKKFGILNIKPKPRMLVFIYLVQDIDLALPIIQKLKSDFNVHVLVSHFVALRSPRTRQILNANNVTWFWLPQPLNFILNIFLPIFYDALITLAETSAPSHAPGYKLTKIFNRRLLPTFTVQHGIENVGLSYSDNEHPLELTLFASQHIFSWFALHDLPKNLPDVTVKKIVVSGCYKEPVTNSHLDSKELFKNFTTKVGIFENLHWHRYDSHYRDTFVEAVRRLIKDFPKLLFVVKPHHAGLWLSQNSSFIETTNLRIFDPRSPKFQPFTAPALISHLDIVLTTPSTVALDAALQKKPVGLLSFGLKTDIYSPLPQLHTYEELKDFLQLALEDCKVILQKTDNFCKKLKPYSDPLELIRLKIETELNREEPNR